MLSQLGRLKIRRRQFFSSLGVVAALTPVSFASSPEPVLIPIPVEFPRPKFHFGQKVKVCVELEDEDEIITEYGIIVGMSYEPDETDEEEWNYLLRWTQGDSSEWLVSAGGTVFFSEWEIEALR
jgi:hypothetical protein